MSKRLALVLLLLGCGPQLGPAVGQSPPAAQDGGGGAAPDLGRDLAPADDCRACTQTAPSAGMAGGDAQAGALATPGGGTSPAAPPRPEAATSDCTCSAWYAPPEARRRCAPGCPASVSDQRAGQVASVTSPAGAPSPAEGDGRSGPQAAGAVPLPPAVPVGGALLQVFAGLVAQGILTAEEVESWRSAAAALRALERAMVAKLITHLNRAPWLPTGSGA